MGGKVWDLVSVYSIVEDWESNSAGFLFSDMPAYWRENWKSSVAC